MSFEDFDDFDDEDRPRPPLKYDFTGFIPASVIELATKLGPLTYIVGGAVRDLVAQAENVEHFQMPTDWDLEVYDVSIEQLKIILASYNFKHTGNHFPVYKIKTQDGEIDVALPRAETRTGKRHKDFDVKILSHKDRYVACRRRDFTINSMMYNPSTMELYDPFFGRNDLINRALRPTYESSFEEDPLRVLRAAKFLSRFRLTPVDLHLVSEMSFDKLPKERIYWEFVDMLRDGAQPSLGLKFLKETGHIREYFPELDDLVGVPQDPHHHPEGDAFTHTCLVADEACKEKLPLYAKFAALTHDMGKATTTVKRHKNTGWMWTSWGHAKAGCEPAVAFMRRLTDDADLIHKVKTITLHHMDLTLMMKRFEPSFAREIKANQLKKLAHKMQPLTLNDLIDFTLVDKLGRLEPRRTIIQVTRDELRRIAASLNIDSKPEPKLITGKVLIELGLSPGEDFGDIIDAAYSAQLNGEFDTLENALRWLKSTYPLCINCHSMIAPNESRASMIDPNSGDRGLICGTCDKDFRSSITDPRWNDNSWLISWRKTRKD